MPAIDAEQHLKFLLSCIKHASAGKVNFDAVAQELGIVSKAAAAKRYERLLKAHDINPASIPKGGEASTTTPKKTPTKRKRNEAPPLKDEDDESEDQPMMAKKEKKAAVKKGKKGENDKTDGGVGVDGRSLYEIPEFPRHLLASQREGDAENEDGEEVVYLGESAGNRRGDEETGVKAETAGNGHGIEGSGSGWNIANPVFDFQQPRSPLLLMTRRNSRSRSMMTPMARFDSPQQSPSVSSAHTVGYYGAGVEDGSYGGVGGGSGSSSTSAAQIAMADADLQAIYRQQFGDGCYDHQNTWGN
ncbi:hypothetical protein QBC40DRAFT_291652 [Triangularia verruculosa]|uniref:Myb-like DNA-binding domain-containing protein n=1 Tax=Triangularia verruculosa TaxID=2587418 RepID=A0AAN6XW45_9PEZI|nr:hypothetical protein QBC40DRAFT_291652 [Triangularia verruculosa]